MMVLELVIRIVIWCVQLIIEIIYIPIFFLRLFKTPKKCPPIKNDLLLIRASELARRIRKNQISSVAVVQAYISRINEVNSLINAVIENRFPEALEDARRADDIVLHSGLNEEQLSEKYPLLGVPITIKGSIAVAGLNHGAGRVDYQEKAKRDAVAVQKAKEAGAVVLLISNIPELCLNWETTNKLIGTTANPYNTTRTPGGSSGGEASLLACGASLMGIGSDICGSVRLPAHFCGVWGHKPTPYVISTVGHRPDGLNKKRWCNYFTFGPMTRYATDLRLLLSTIAEPNMKSMLELHQSVDVKKIKLYYIQDLNCFHAKNFNKNVVTAFEKVVAHFDVVCQLECTKVTIPLMRNCAQLCFLSLLDVGKLNGMCEGEQIFEIFKFLTGQSKQAFNTVSLYMLRSVVPTVLSKFMKQVSRNLDKLRDDFIKILGDDGVFILPSHCSEAPYHNNVYRTVFDTAYLTIFNALGFPATNCPVMFSPDGLPVGIQVVAAPNLDRLTLCVAEEIERAFGGWKFT
ncbi:fatty-acid amide hydrolase 2-B-like isoform X2 [Zophobas morio]|uniref:fatty-acid amide hydrolase 2-B-like isoform X2 n=1 Tax=Zophobas morio TaxID=2755281 RepID=UPI003082E930